MFSRSNEAMLQHFTPAMYNSAKDLYEYNTGCDHKCIC